MEARSTALGMVTLQYYSVAPLALDNCDPIDGGWCYRGIRRQFVGNANQILHIRIEQPANAIADGTMTRRQTTGRWWWINPFSKNRHSRSHDVQSDLLYITDVTVGFDLHVHIQMDTQRFCRGAISDMPAVVDMLARGVGVRIDQTLET